MNAFEQCSVVDQYPNTSRRINHFNDTQTDTDSRQRLPWFCLGQVKAKNSPI
jgi:hypothetical protein